MLRSLRSRLGLTYAVIAAVMLVVAYFVAASSIDAALVRSAAERLEIEAGLVVADSIGGRGATATDLAAGDLAIVLGGYGTAVAILDAEGSVLAAEPNGADPAVLNARLDPATYAGVVASGQTIHAVRSATDGGRMLLVAAPVQLRTGGPPGNPGKGNGQGQGRGLGNQGRGAGVAVGPANAVAQLSISLDGVDAAVADAQSMLQLAVLLLVLAAAAAVWIITAIGLRPIERVARAAQRIAGGDLDARAALPAGQDEVGRLGQAFDEMAERVETTLRAQRTFAADTSHELRSPLTVLGGYVDVLGGRGVDPETRDRTLGSMRREIDRLSRLSNDLLLLTQLEAGGGRVARTVVDLRSLAEDMGSAAQVLGPDRRVEVVADGAVPVVADADRLTQAVMNLVDNAVRHTPPGMDIRIAAARSDGWGSIEIANRGERIPEPELEHIFDRFYRAGGRSIDGQHAGLGLAIAKAIAEAMGGSVGATSTEAGTAFTIRLPAAS